jgi:Spy/CpxP family protein refolding chaperone
VVAVKAAAVVVVSAAAVAAAAAVTDLPPHPANAGEIESPQALPRGFFLLCQLLRGLLSSPIWGRLAFSERGWQQTTKPAPIRRGQTTP